MQRLAWLAGIVSGLALAAGAARADTQALTILHDKIGRAHV